MSITAPYGSWESPVGAADTVADIVRFSDLQYDDGSLYWLESRPSEGGRAALVRRTDDGEIEDVLPDTANVRTMAHEYGGAAVSGRVGRSRLFGVHRSAVVPSRRPMGPRRR